MILFNVKTRKKLCLPAVVMDVVFVHCIALFVLTLVVTVGAIPHRSRCIVEEVDCHPERLCFEL